jgi:malate synthase
MEVFDRYMPGPNQLDRPVSDEVIDAADLLALPEGTITEAGLRNNVSAALRYLAAWLGGRGAVPIHNLMEDAATAEIARAQLWQWIRYPKGVLDDGRKVTAAMFEQAVREELDQVRSEMGDLGFGGGHFAWAAELLRDIVTAESFEEFLTLPAYRDLGGTQPCG